MLGRASSDEAVRQALEPRLHFHAGSQETPPEFSAAFVLLRFPFWFDFLLNNRKRLDILLHPLNRPILKIDNAATGSLIRLIVEFLAVDDRHDHFVVPGIGCTQARGFFVGQQEPVAEENGALKHPVAVVKNGVRFPEALPLFKEGVDQRDRLVVEHSRAVPLPLVHSQE